MCLVRTIKDKQCSTELTTRRLYIYSLPVLMSMLHMHDHEVARKQGVLTVREHAALCTLDREIFTTNNIRVFHELTRPVNFFVANVSAHVPKYI